MAHLQLQLHSGLIRGGGRTWRTRQHTPHLQSGTIDASSGALSLLMALIVLGVASKGQVVSLRHGTDYRLGRTWERCLESYFVGATADNLIEVLSTIASSVHHTAFTGSTRKCMTFAAERLTQGDLVILGMGAEAEFPTHWTLAVGTESIGRELWTVPMGLLCLDPSEPASVAPFNARLLLDSPRRGASQLHYAVPGRILSMGCQTAIALSRRSKAGGQQ